MDKKQFFLGMLLASLLGAIIALGGFKLMVDDKPGYVNFEQSQGVRFSNFLADSAFTVPEGLNFVYAAEMTTPAVVHIRATISNDAIAQRNPGEDFFREFFGGAPERRSPRQGASAGSGVIISSNGYITTNNHVISNASKIEVVLNDNRKYTAKVIGTDPSTDLALLKIDEESLPFIPLGNSDNIRVGEWVLAVGNPFDLTSTVTAGIVSAKGRNINLLRNPDLRSIEAFIQTDAAVNPGNSGGALVNLRGELVGINTAIATMTGSYSGYSFAVPVSIVKKVMDDLMEYGVVQRAMLGIRIMDVNADLAKEFKLKDTRGVYVAGVEEGSGAKDAGLKEGDVILAVDGSETLTVARLQETIAQRRPGEKVKVKVIREGKEQMVDVVLKNTMNRAEIVTVSATNIEGGEFVGLDDSEKKKLGIDGGAKLQKVNPGKWREAGMKEGFVITEVDKTPIKSPEDLVKALKNKKGGILIEGRQPNGEQAFYGLGW